VCVIINNSSFPTVKNNNTAYHAFGKYWMQARGLLNYRLKYCWPKVIYCIRQPNELERETTKKTGGASKNLGGYGPPRPPLESPVSSNAPQFDRVQRQDNSWDLLPPFSTCQYKSQNTGYDSIEIPRIVFLLMCQHKPVETYMKMMQRIKLQTKLFAVESCYFNVVQLIATVANLGRNGI